MAQENATQWDLRSLTIPLQLDEKLFVFLMLAILVIVGVNLFRSLRLSRASRLGHLADPVSYRDALEKIRSSLKQWIFVPLFAWGLLASRHLYLLWGDLLVEKDIHRTMMFYNLRQLAAELYLATLVSFAAFLVRWYILKRLGKLRA